MFDNSLGYDSQGCVEDALRRRPHREMLVQARAEFELSCRASDPAACSALGVMAELGLAGDADPKLARSLYRRACEGGNQRGCVNSGRLTVATSSSTPAELDRARGMFAFACEEHEMTGCTALGRMFADGRGVTKDVTAARALLERGCAARDAEACFQLAELPLAGGASDPMQVAELYVKACVAGHQAACERMGTPPPAAAPAAVAKR